jgi:hypothetical protein
MTVMGEVPDDMGTKQVGAAGKVGTVIGASVGDVAKDEEIIRLRTELKIARAGTGEFQEAQRAVTVKSGDMGQEMQKLQDTILQLEKEKASMKGGSGACSI